MNTIDRQTMTTGVSRRTALRGAAWTASAVTVVVATPNFAAASDGVPSATVTTGTLVKCSVQSSKHVVGDFILNNTGSVALTGLYVVFTFSETAATQPSSMAVTSTSSVLSGTSTWSGSVSNLTATYPIGQVNLGETVSVHVDLGGVNNAAGTLTAKFYVAGNPSPVLVGSATETWTSVGAC